MLKCIGEVLRNEERHDRLRCSNFYPYDKTLTLYDLIQKPSSFSDVDKYKVKYFVIKIKKKM